MEIYIKLEGGDKFPLQSVVAREQECSTSARMVMTTNGVLIISHGQGFNLSFTCHPSNDEINLFTCFLEGMFIQTHATVYTVHRSSLV